MLRGSASSCSGAAVKASEKSGFQCQSMPRPAGLAAVPPSAVKAKRGGEYGHDAVRFPVC